ncbi:exocyst complex component 2-like [Coccinella septempunctata]|uniref:exocyst complex component 2-like n=1 Tax=Coccinella septempunctata TaxID=41139 RepID=UPI001D096C49|nr:exocyst complex component 2-like [Coccinella septempunctata]
MNHPKQEVIYTKKLQNSIIKSEIEAKKLFGEVLVNRDKVERTRNALSILTRFKFLFCLPSTIVKNIEKAEYEVVINDYMRVRNLFERSDVPIFQAALAEINLHIEGLIKKLHLELQTMPISVEQQKQIIRYLMNLDCPFDPAWDAIKSRSDYISETIKSVYTFYKSLDKGENGQKTKVNNTKCKYMQQPDPVPMNITFAEEMCSTISDNFPDLWKISQAYFNQELQTIIDTSKTEDIKNMVMSLMQAFCKTIRSAIIPHTLEAADRNSLGSWSSPDLRDMALYLPELLRSIRSTYATLIKLDLPRDALAIISALLLDLRIYCMVVLFKQTINQIKLLDEDWNLLYNKKKNGITNLPVKFEQIVQDVIQVVKESVLSNERGDSSLLKNPSALKELHKQVENVLSAFYNLLQELSSSDDYSDEEENSSATSHLIGIPINMYKYENNSKSYSPPWEHKLLITMSNCMFTRNIVLDNIFKAFVSSGYPQPDEPVKNTKYKLENLEKLILEKYLEQKSDPIVGTIEPSMYLGRFDWDYKFPPNDIQEYVKECINNLIQVHAEVNSVSPALVEMILPQIVQTIAEEIYRLMSCVRKFSNPGTQQARIDIIAMREFFSHYCSENANVHFQDALDLIPKLDEEEEKKVQEILRQVRPRMKIQMICLGATKNGPSKETADSI